MHFKPLCTTQKIYHPALDIHNRCLSLH